MIVNGECDALPEQAFYMVGPIEEAFEKAKSLQEPSATAQSAAAAQKPAAAPSASGTKK
jgi:hypothetical protein